ncbi:DUF1648 domain-containing protein [Candidatus Micrarchaeota archaeon]|nr:DUF1648 domain-containing protein [Candidatus Micrarchaeota archaeon]
MNLRKSEIVMLAIVVLSFAIAIYFFPQMPEQVASHWNSNGEVNGYMDSFWGTFLMPVISVLLLLMFLAIPRIDPLKANIERFRKHYDRLIIITMAFMLYIYLLTIAWNLGTRFDMARLLLPALAVLFYFIGGVLKESKRNWFVGIRTPWTLSSDAVWEKTHKRGALLFRLFALVVLIGLFVPGQTVLIVLVPVLAGTIYLVAYSYFEYRKETKHAGKGKR